MKKQFKWYVKQYNNNTKNNVNFDKIFMYIWFEELKMYSINIKNYNLSNQKDFDPFNFIGRYYYTSKYIFCYNNNNYYVTLYDYKIIKERT